MNPMIQTRHWRREAGRGAALLMALACSGADEAGREPLGADALSACAKGSLEADRVEDQPLAGPGVDPVSGELSPGDYVIATTYLALQPDKRQATGELAQPVLDSLTSMGGLVAVAFSGSESCASLRTLSVWETEEDLFAFVISPAHSRAISELSSVSRGYSNTISWRAGAEAATWAEAARRLGAEVGGDR